MAQERPSFYDPASAAAIMLPDGRVCNYVGAEPRPRDLGDPVTYRCSDGRGLRGGSDDRRHLHDRLIEKALKTWIGTPS